VISAHIYGKMGEVKTTVEIPDHLFRRAKSSAAQQGIALKDFFTDAIRQHLHQKAAGPASDKAWMKAFGALRDLHRENKRIDRVIADEFERIDQEDWR